jgi:DNA-binding CsgD family transcriptional regulator
MANSVQRRSDGSTATVQALLDRARTAGIARGLRSDIVGSWQRSALVGLTPDVFDVPFDADIDERGRLAWAGDRAMDRIADDLDGVRVGLVLTDERGIVVSRRATNRRTRVLLDEIHLAPGYGYGEPRIGTNAIGTALASRVPTYVEAAEHFADALTTMVCAAAPVTDPASGRVLGVVDMTCAAADANPLMLPYVKRAAREIEQRLLDDSSAGERVLQERFLRARRGVRTPLIGVSQRSFLLNAAAANLIEEADRERLWHLVLQARGAGELRFTFCLSSGNPVSMHGQVVVDGAEFVGALLGWESDGGTRATALGSRARGSARDFGWQSLTDSELAVAVQVSQGMTNREAAAHLFVSPHTVDFHLRQLFRKLDVRSRVELTRVVLENRPEYPTDPGLDARLGDRAAILEVIGRPG